MAQAVTHHPFNTQAKFQFQASPVGCVVYKVALGQVSLQILLFSLVSNHSASAPYPFVYHQNCIILTVDRIVK